MSDAEPQGLQIPAGPMTPFGFPYGQPPSPSLALKAARHVIYEEQRWVHGHLMSPAPLLTPTGKISKAVSAEAQKAKEAAANCTNVKVCAVGAVIVVCYNGPAIGAWIGGDYKTLMAVGLKPPENAPEDDEDMSDWMDESWLLSQHPIGSRAIEYLGRAIDTDFDLHYHKDERINGAVSGTIELNDAIRNRGVEESKKHLEKVVAAFDKAIALAEADEAQLTDDLSDAIEAVTADEEGKQYPDHEVDGSKIHDHDEDEDK